VATARQFRLELDQFARAIDGQAVDFQKRLVAELFTAINLANPVGNPSRWKKPRKSYVGGQSRRNWRIAIDLPDRTERSGVDPSGARSQSEAFAVLASLRRPANVWISNPLAYMDRLENGWSRQAPNGIVKTSVQAIARKYGLRVLP